MIIIQRINISTCRLKIFGKGFFGGFYIKIIILERIFLGGTSFGENNIPGRSRSGFKKNNLGSKIKNLLS